MSRPETLPYPADWPNGLLESDEQLERIMTFEEMFWELCNKLGLE